MYPSCPLQLRQAEDKLQEVVDIAKTNGIGLDTLIKSLTLFYEEE